MGIPDHLTCLLRNLYAGQEATVRTGYGIKNWFPIGKGVIQPCILSPYLFNLYAEYFMWNAELDEAQAAIKIAGRNISNLRYTNDTTLMAESEEELKSILMNVKEESGKLALNSTFKKQRSWHLIHYFMTNSWGNNGNWDNLFWGAPKSLQMVTAASHEMKRCLLLGRKVMTNLGSILKSREITLPTKVHLVKAMVFQ